MKFSASAAAFALAMVVPTSVAAAPPVVTPEVVKPQVVKPQVVKPQVVKPQPVAPAPEPSPEPEATPIPRSVPGSSSSPAPTPSTPPSHSPVYGPSLDDGPPAEDEVPGAHIPGSVADPPYPEGLPPHWRNDCDLDCLQEWHGWYSARWSVVSTDALGGTTQDRLNADLLFDEVKAIEAEIEALGSNHDYFDDYTAGQVPYVDSHSDFSSGEAAVSLLPKNVVEAIDAAIATAINDVLGGSGIPDAITSAGAITPRDGAATTPPDASTPQEVDLGSWDLSGVVDAASAVSGVAIGTAIAKGLAAITGICSGPKIQDKPEFCPQ